MTKNVTIDLLFEQQALEKPKAVAVVHLSNTLTYQELNSKANQLAHFLRSKNINAGVPVGICLHRSPEAIIALLGVLKAGGVYVPIDPDAPKNKITHIITETKINILLTNKSVLSCLPSHLTVEALDINAEEIGQYPDTAPAKCHDENNLAYILFTSGTTGLPKGVMVTQANLVNAYQGWDLVYRLKSEIKNHLQMANFTFDVFSGDMVRAFCSGGKLVICPKHIFLNPEKLFELICKENIDCGEFVPAILRKLMNYIEENKQQLTIKLLICGSDSWTVGEYKKFQHLCSAKTRLINSYGMTEATIDSTYFESANQTSWGLDDHALVPIGKPFPNVEIYLLDEKLNRVSFGEEGEIFIGGKGISQGYLNNPTLTSERFIQNPFVQDNSEMYKTGDWGRAIEDHGIELLGRMDHQIKINGHRIELSGVETVLNTHPAVAASIVTVGKKSTVSHLVAYLKLKESVTITYNEILNFLEHHLPSYMIPIDYRIINDIPLTSSGKHDREAIQSIPHKNLSKVHFSPDTALEKKLAELWSKHLDIEKVSVKDNFFYLGGTSLHLVQLVSEINDTFKTTLCIHDLLERPTIKQLSSMMESAQEFARNSSN